LHSPDFSQILVDQGNHTHGRPGEGFARDETIPLCPGEESSAQIFRVRELLGKLAIQCWEEKYPVKELVTEDGEAVVPG
jgi:hypothetical protein